MYLKKPATLFKYLTLLTLSNLAKPLVTLEISLPAKCKTEGKITLLYPRGDQSLQYHFAFTESMDSSTDRSAISIGHVAYEPTTYFSRPDSPTITVNSVGVCSAIDHLTSFVPEISWFVERMVPVKLPKHLPGPTGLLEVFFHLTATSTKLSFDRSVIHRNIPCDVYSRSYNLPERPEVAIKFEVFTPTINLQFRNTASTYFSVQGVATNTSNPDANNNKLSFVIDYYDVDSKDGDPEGFERMKDDFNLPSGFGCSEFLKQVQPEIKSESFSLKYRQQSSSSTVLMAYDHLAGLLRKEIVGKTLSIWDLNEDLLYHVNTNVADTLKNDFNYLGNLQVCSVFQVIDDQLGHRPYEEHNKPIEMLHLIGAKNVAYLGRGSERDLPTFTYETVLPNPPILFAMTQDQLNVHPEMQKDYIVQFHILQGKQSTSNDLEPVLQVNGFWPVKIVLFRRLKRPDDGPLIEYVDHLEIYDFYWSLFGWDKKSTELFMASECFDDEVEQLRVDLAFVFERVHLGSAKNNDKQLLSYNKFKLEYDLINDIFKLFDISKLHLAEYELKLRPSHVNLNMIIADRKEEKKLIYFGEGNLPNENSYDMNRAIVKGYDEETCVSMSSHIADISLVVYCPVGASQGSSESTTCTAVYNEPEPTITHVEYRKLDELTCRAYRYLPNGVPKSGTHNVMSKSASLYRHHLEFLARDPQASDSLEVLKGFVRNYDVVHETQLITVNHYMFSLDQTTDNNRQQADSTNNHQVQSFNSITYRSESDCARICNLDTSCKSYSYCVAPKKVADNHSSNRCILSTLDIRASKVLDQLVHSSGPQAGNNQITVYGEDGKVPYKLTLADRCDIHERDYLNFFRQTEEILRLDADAINQFETAPTTFECAKLSVDLEKRSEIHHIAMFAYCATTHTCILDENLFAPTKTSDSTQIESPTDRDDSERIENEAICRVYRKKYQTYFKVSGEVLKVAEKENNDKQINLELNSVEECARACWIKLGQVCASFDYCAPGSCLINQVSLAQDKGGNYELETRSGCLHYERDLRLDELRKQHSIGRHELLVQDEPTSSWGWFLVNMFTASLVVGAFVYGLVLGRNLNDKMEARTIFRLSISVPGPSQMFGFQAFSSGSNSRGETNQLEDMDNGGAIKLDVMKNGTTVESEPLERDF